MFPAECRDLKTKWIIRRQHLTLKRHIIDIAAGVAASIDVTESSQNERCI